MTTLTNDTFSLHDTISSSPYFITQEGIEVDREIIDNSIETNKQDEKYFLSEEYVTTVDDQYTDQDKLSDFHLLVFEKMENELSEVIEKEREYLASENVLPPSELVFNNTLKLFKEIASCEIFPISISTSIEGGIHLVFRNNSNKLYLEIYNDGDIAYLIEDSKSKKLIQSKDLSYLLEAVEILKEFHL